MLSRSLSVSYEDFHLSKQFVLESKKHDLIVCIPAYAEMYIEDTINSILHGDSCHVNVGILVLINGGVDAPGPDKVINQTCFEKLGHAFTGDNFSNFTLYILYVFDVPSKWAGVGNARKMAMDLAYELLDDKDGPIINLDADSIVSRNYLNAIESFFRLNAKIELANIYYSHNLDSGVNTRQIIEYEIHLRYFIKMQRYLALPYAYHTVGSSFAVRGRAYLQVGGMNKRKAGEDFYFIHKFTKKGTIGEINGCTVIPSSRESTRVPFGTGRAIIQLLESEIEWHTYNPMSFELLKPLFFSLQESYSLSSFSLKHLQLNPIVESYFRSIGFELICVKLSSNVTTLEGFLKSFFQWFDAFMLMKYLHHMRDHGYKDIPISSIGQEAFPYLAIENHKNLGNYLNSLRQIERNFLYSGVKAMREAYGQK
jgi:hypothetical protein